MVRLEYLTPPVPQWIELNLVKIWSVYVYSASRLSYGMSYQIVCANLYIHHISEIVSRRDCSFSLVSRSKICQLVPQLLKMFSAKSKKEKVSFILF